MRLNCNASPTAPPTQAPRPHTLVNTATATATHTLLQQCPPRPHLALCHLDRLQADVQADGHRLGQQDDEAHHLHQPGADARGQLRPASLGNRSDSSSGGSGGSDCRSSGGGSARTGGVGSSWRTKPPSMQQGTCETVLSWQTDNRLCCCHTPAASMKVGVPTIPQSCPSPPPL